ncbi:Uma2 family endonuclease [Flavobacterium psychrotrophum]|uniref:Uma2 family endonuclease n=1 Tax=Flavobacterium psychrotrophum TaxID=2294119 RepID=UPI000E30F5A1|nr:Uma2 family endonuclease [Flavobacterium psychrotrophum]
MPAITDISQLDMDKTYSYADYLTWKFQDRLELLKGKIFKMSPAPGRTHQTIVGRFHIELAKYFAKGKCQLYLSPFDVRMLNRKKSTPDKEVYTVVQPDLCVVCSEDKLDERGCNGAPDLVIEILSPGNSKKELGIKFDLYEEAGVLEYWIVEPAEKTVFVYSLVNGKLSGQRPLTEDDLIKSPLFPQLDFSIAEIFE